MLGIVGQGWHLVMALLVQVLVARVFGPALFGTWQVVLSVLGWFEILIQAGIGRVTTKAISEDPERCRTLSWAAYAAQMCVALAAFLALIVAAGPIARALGNPSYAPLLRIASLDIPLFGLFMVASSVVLGVERFERQGVAWIVYATAKAAFIAAFVLVGYSVAGALVGNALSSLIGFAVVFIPASGERPSREQTIELARWMLVASVPFLTLALMGGAQSADLWLVSAMVPSRVLVGYYASATVLAEIPVFLFLGLNRVIFPSVARARAGGDPELAAHYTKQAIRLALIVTVAAVAFIAAAGRQVIVLIYGAKFVAAYVPVVLLMGSGMGRTIRGTCTEVLMAEDRRRQVLAILSVTVLLEVGLVVVLTPRFGLNGAAAGTAVSALIAGVWGMVLLRSSIGVRPLATFARSVAASAVIAVGIAFVIPPVTAPVAVLLPATVGCLALAGVLYLGGLWVLGEFSADDIASVRTALGRGAS